MFYRHLLLRCFPDIHVDQVHIQVERLLEAGDVHADWNVAGTGDRPLQPLLQNPSRQGLLRLSRWHEVQDRYGHHQKGRVTLCLF